MSRFAVRTAVQAALAIAALAGGTTHPGFAAVTAGAGVDYVSGPMKQSTRDVLGFLVASWSGKDLTLSAARFDHSDVGSGTIGSAEVGIPIVPSVALRCTGARTVGDESYRAWLFQAGPLFAIGGGRTLGILYTRSGNNLTVPSTGLSSEVGIPVSTSVNALARGTIASVEGGGTSLQGSLGMNWGFARRLVLLAELGAGRDVTALAQGGGVSPGEPGLLGLGASPPQSRIGGPTYISGTALQIGLRYIIH